MPLDASCACQEPSLRPAESLNPRLIMHCLPQSSPCSCARAPARRGGSTFSWTGQARVRQTNLHTPRTRCLLVSLPSPTRFPGAINRADAHAKHDAGPGRRHHCPPRRPDLRPARAHPHRTPRRAECHPRPKSPPRFARGARCRAPRAQQAGIDVVLGDGVGRVQVHLGTGRRRALGEQGLHVDGGALRPLLFAPRLLTTRDELLTEVCVRRTASLTRASPSWSSRHARREEASKCSTTTSRCVVSCAPSSRLSLLIQCGLRSASTLPSRIRRVRCAVDPFVRCAATDPPVRRSRDCLAPRPLPFHRQPLSPRHLPRCIRLTVTRCRHCGRVSSSPLSTGTASSAASVPTAEEEQLDDARDKRDRGDGRERAGHGGALRAVSSVARGAPRLSPAACETRNGLIHEHLPCAGPRAPLPQHLDLDSDRRARRGGPRRARQAQAVQGQRRGGTAVCRR